MKLGYIECKTNSFDAFEAVSIATGQIGGCEVVKSTAPELLKIPAAAKKAFSEQYVDAIIAFATAGEDEHDALALVHEKIIDVEVELGKYIFFVAVHPDAQTDAAKELVEAVSKASEAVGVGSISTPPATGMDMFSQPGASAQETQGGGTEQDIREIMEESDVHKLF